MDCPSHHFVNCYYLQVSYKQALDQVLAEGGIPGLLTRGLTTRLMVNALQVERILYRFLSPLE